MLFVILVLLLSIPAIQTRLGKKATNYLNSEFKTNINVGRVGLQFNGDVELKDILILDYKKDTLISATELNTSILSINNLINSKLNFGDIDLEDLEFNIKTYKGETDTNLNVFVDRFENNNPKVSTNTFLLSSSDVSIYNGVFRLIDENKQTPKVIEFLNLNINATDFLINGSDVNARINTLSFMDSRGLQVKNMSTNFGYTLEAMTFDDLLVKTEASELKGDLVFKYKREDFKEFVDKVKVEANFKNSKVELQELNVFYNEFGRNQRAHFSTSIHGTLNNLFADNLYLTTSSKTKIVGDINFKNLFNAEADNFVMDGKFKDLSSTYKDLKALLPNVLGESIPEVFDKLGEFKIIGSTNITSTNILADFEIITELGLLNSDLNINRINDINNAKYTGNIVLDDFDLGTFLNDPKLGKASLNLNVDGFGFTKENINTQLKGDVYDLFYNNYNYKNVIVSGTLRDKVFNGKLNANDSNIKLEFNGLADFSKEIYDFDFEADVDYLNLKALQLYSKDSISVFKGIVKMDMKGTNVNNAVGEISFKNTAYKNQNDSYKFEDFAVTSSFKGEERTITVNSPEIIEGELNGVFKFEDIETLFTNSVKSIYTNYQPNLLASNQYINFNFKVYNKIVEVFFPELKLGKNTYVKGRVESDEKAFKLTFKSPEIKWLDYFASNIEVQMDNNNPLFNTYLEIDSLNTKFYNVSKFNLINVTLNDTLFMRSEFNGGKRNNDIYNLSMYHTTTARNTSILGFKKSDITVKDNTWFINEAGDGYNKIEFDTKFTSFDFDKFLINHNEEIIQLSGLVQNNEVKDANLLFTDVKLKNITPDIKGVNLSGIVNGSLDILQKNGSYIPKSDITVDEFVFNDQNLGAFEALIEGNSSFTKYNVDAKIKGDVKNTLTAKGNIDVSSKSPSIDVNLNLNGFSFEFLNPFLKDVLSNIRGDAYGNVAVVGNLNKPNFNGDLKIKHGGLKVDVLNVDYAFNEDASITLNNQNFNFNNIELTDIQKGTMANLNGYISHVNFSKWRLGLDLDTDNLLVLNTKYTPDVLYYGTGYIGGSATISGPTEALRINVIAETKPNTKFVIPLNDNESFGDNSYIHFLSPEEKLAKQEGVAFKIENSAGLQLDFDLDVTQDAEIEIVIDRDSGSTIKGRGAGGLLVNINTNGDFKMFGDFVVYKGDYNFLFGGIIEKKFTVKPYESTLAWNGPPLDALINIKAIYESNANPSALLDTPISRSIPVNLELSLTNKLEQPDIDYNFEFPNVSSTIKSELQYRLETKEDREKQALFFLASGSFNRELGNLNATGTLAERLNSVVNSLLSNGDGKFDVGLNYQAGEKQADYQTDDRLGVSLQTKISDRILINGKVGVPVGGVSETVIAGNIQVDFLLNEEGSLAAKVFNQENSIQNFGEDIGYTQGVGITYNVEFDNLKELKDKIFKTKEKREAEAEAKLKEEFAKDTIKTSNSAFGFKPKTD